MQSLIPIGSRTRSLYTYPRRGYINDKLTENINKYRDYRSHQIGRINSNHLLYKLITALRSGAVTNPIDSSTGFDKLVYQVASSLDITTPFNRGSVFTNSVFYPDCHEIITYVPDARLELMYLDGWQNLQPIRVLRHPVTDPTFFDLGVMNPAFLDNGGICVINVDIKALMVQYNLYRLTYPAGSIEGYLTQYALRNMMPSHLDVVYFNNVLLEFGMIKPCTVRTNLPFAQTDVKSLMGEIGKLTYKNLVTQSPTLMDTLTSIPAYQQDNYYKAVPALASPDLMQIQWALDISRIQPVCLGLEVSSRFDFGKTTDLVARVKRWRSATNEDKSFKTGFTTSERAVLEDDIQWYMQVLDK